MRHLAISAALLVAACGTPLATETQLQYFRSLEPDAVPAVRPPAVPSAEALPATQPVDGAFRNLSVTGDITLDTTARIFGYFKETQEAVEVGPGTVDNWDPTAKTSHTWQTHFAPLVLMVINNSGMDVGVTGLVGGTDANGNEGRHVTVWNTSLQHNLIVHSQSSASLNENQFETPGNTDLVIPPRAMADFTYLFVKWRPAGRGF